MVNIIRLVVLYVVVAPHCVYASAPVVDVSSEHQRMLLKWFVSYSNKDDSAGKVVVQDPVCTGYAIDSASGMTDGYSVGKINNEYLNSNDPVTGNIINRGPEIISFVFRESKSGHSAMVSAIDDSCIAHMAIALRDRDRQQSVSSTVREVGSPTYNATVELGALPSGNYDLILSVIDSYGKSDIEIIKSISVHGDSVSSEFADVLNEDNIDTTNRVVNTNTNSEKHTGLGKLYEHEANDKLSIDDLLSEKKEHTSVDEGDMKHAENNSFYYAPPSFNVNEKITGVAVDLSSWDVRSVSDVVMLRERSPEDVLWRKGMVPLKKRRSREIGWGVSEKSIAESVIDNNPVTIWPVDLRIRGGGEIQELYIANKDLAELKSQNILSVMENGKIVFIVKGAE